MKKPKIYFIGVGASRSATNWIADCLRDHPELFVPFPNELHFFLKPRSGGKSNYELEGIKGYYKRFAGSINKKAGEFSPSYFSQKGIATIIKKNFPNIKILISLRNPIDRYYSELTHRKYFEQEKISKEDLINNSLYFNRLLPYLENFPKKNIFIVIVDDIYKDPKKVMREIYSFLGVNNQFISKNIFSNKNTKSIPKYQSLVFFRKGLSKIIEFLKQNKMSWLINLFRWTKINNLSWYIWEKNRMSARNLPKLSLEEKKELQKIFLPDIEKVEKLLKRDLSNWKKIN